jgi:LEA14-like dessication related protein
MMLSFNRTISFFIIGLFCIGIVGCTPKEKIVFKGVKNIEVQMDDNQEPLLTAEAFFYNPNNVKMKLKEVNVDVLVNGKLSARVRQNLKLVIPSQADFSAPINARLSLKELGLLDTIINLIGGKKYEIQYIGFIRVAVHGITIKVPVNSKEELRIRL